MNFNLASPTFSSLLSHISRMAPPNHAIVRVPFIHPNRHHPVLWVPVFMKSPPLCMFHSEELLHSEHLGPNELEAPAPGGSSEDKSGLQPLDPKGGELTQMHITPDFGGQGLNLSSNPLKSGGVLATG